MGSTPKFSASSTVKTPRPEFALDQNYPNPFNPSTTIRFVLPEKTSVRLSVYDAGGRFVVNLMNGTFSSGAGEIVWDGKDANGTAVGTGVYFYQLQAGTTVMTKKMILLK